MKLKRVTNKEVRKWDQKQKNDRSGITSLQYKPNFHLKLKKHIE